jgi:uncharacterized protein (TIGR02266 family)
MVAQRPSEASALVRASHFRSDGGTCGWRRALTANKRQFERVNAQLVIRFPKGDTVVEGRTRDVSLGGTFVNTDAALPYGTVAVFELVLPALPEPAKIEGTVRWSSSDGMGVQFHSLRARETWAINQLFRG